MRRERGQNLVEFALLTPIVLLMLGAIVNAGLGMHTRSNLQQAVREGARQASVGQPLSVVQDLGSGNSGGTLSPGDVQWCLPTGSDGSAGDEIRVYIDEDNDGSEGYNFTLIPAIGIFQAFGWTSDLTVNMDPEATARLEKSKTGVPACAS